MTVIFYIVLAFLGVCILAVFCVLAFQLKELWQSWGDWRPEKIEKSLRDEISYWSKVASAANMAGDDVDKRFSRRQITRAERKLRRLKIEMEA